MLYFLYVIIVIAFLDTFVQLPIIAPFAQSLGANSLMIGLIIGTYSLANMGGNVIAGLWIDKFGRKKILVTGLLFVSVCLVAYALVNTPLQLLAIRTIHGIGGGLLVPAAFAFLGDHAKKRTRGKTMAFSGACVGISAIIGPAFGAIVTKVYGIDWVFYIISILFFVSALLVVFVLKEIYSPREKKDTFSVASIRRLLGLPPLVNAYIGAFSLMLAMGILAYMLPLKIEAAAHSVALSGILLSTFGIVAILVFLLPTNKLFDQIRREKLIITGMVFVTGALAILGTFEIVPILFGSMVLYGIGFACIFPSMTALVIDHSDQNERGRAFGLFYAFFSLGVVAGSFFIGALNVLPNQGLLVGSLAIGSLAALLYWRITRGDISQSSEKQHS